jgi:transposase
LLARFSDFKCKAKQRTGSDFPIITIHEAGLDGFWVHRVLRNDGNPEPRAGLWIASSLCSSQ